MATKRYKRDLKALEARRRGMRMLKRGVRQADIARELGVSRQTVSTWAKRLADDSQAGRACGGGQAQAGETARQGGVARSDRHGKQPRRHHGRPRRGSG